MPGTIIHKALLATLAVWLFGTSPVLAQELPHRKAKRVAVLPVQRLDIPCDRLFTPEQREDFDGRAIERSIQDSLARLPDVKLLSNQELRKRITGVPRYRDQVVIGRERYLMGHEYYRDLRQQDAETSLQKSTAILENIYYDIVEPHAFSQVLFLLGITLVEVSKAADAHQIFKRALMLSPSTSFTPGYHPQPVEQAMSVACEDLRRSTAREIPLTSIERTVRFMKHNKLSTLVYPVLIKEKDEHELLLIVFERSSRTVTFRQRLPMTDKKSNRERISRAISGWAACASFGQIPKKVEERSRFLLSTSYQQVMFIQKPIRNQLFAMGASFDFAWFFKRSFALVTRIQLLSSLPDLYKDMLDGFTSARLIIGPSFSVTGSWWRLYIQPGAEVHYMGTFNVSRDPACKHFLKDSSGWSQCNSGRVNDFPISVQAGINLALGAQFFFANDLFLGFGFSGATYVAPFDRSFEINFPIAAEVGGGIAF